MENLNSINDQVNETKPEQISWHEPAPESIPEPSYWPFLLAFGIVLILWGLISAWLISLAGVIIFVASLAGWIGEMIHEHD